MIKERRERTNAQETKDDVISREMISHQRKEREMIQHPKKEERERSEIQGKRKRRRCEGDACNSRPPLRKRYVHT